MPALLDVVPEPVEWERVTADKVRAKDLLDAGDVGVLEVEKVITIGKRVHLKSHHRWWSVPLGTKFIRVRRTR